MTSLLKVLGMFKLRIFYDKNNEKDNVMYAIAIKCSNFNKDTGLYIKNTTTEGMITKFVLNAILHHVVMLWIIYSNNEMLYETEEKNNPYRFNKGPWYNTATCSKFHGKLFEDFMRHARTDRYYLMCSIIAHDKQRPFMKMKKEVLEIYQ